jgi:MoaA/NifB/PqqE/SkfB family radical SAM enzyme
MFKKTFCSSPWFHVRLTYDGSFESCRWAKNPKRVERYQTQTLMQYYNSEQMRSLRQQLLDGESPQHCETCYYEESFGKLNGRIRQLNKSAVDIDNFDLTLRSSPHYKNFEFSLNNQGLADMAPVDLQIELGNTCNSACIMCTPEASSRLEADYHKLNAINSKLFIKPDSYNSWTQDPALVDRFVKELVGIPNIRYIHFLGGETLYEPAFYTICEELIAHDRAKDIIIGTTTNGTIYNDRIQSFIEQFKQFHLGISIESVTELNDYIRWPGRIDSILPNIDKFLKLRDTNPGLYVSLRITPNVFSVFEIDKMFVYMLENRVIAESCNILYKPSLLRMELIPEDIRAEIKEKLATLIDYYELSKEPIINVRRADQIDQVTANVILDYYQFICDYTVPADAEPSRVDLVNFLKSFETIRGNSILDYAPRYKEFLRHYGY